ncbi:TPA: hypothetical protein QEK98_002959 [Stenotrophomonas maltophilia]|nr:hypothetical protein [Stenotrophomonas maltophilia]
MKLVINKCHSHGYYAISVEDNNVGIRITPSKCCGGWSTIKEWTLSRNDWLDLAKEATKAAEAMEPRP